MRLIVEVRALTGAGSRGLTMRALRQVEADRRKQPALVGIVGSVSARTAQQAAASEPDGTQFIGPRTCGLVPVKSKWIASSVDGRRDLDADRLVQVDPVIVSQSTSR